MAARFAFSSIFPLIISIIVNGSIVSSSILLPGFELKNSSSSVCSQIDSFSLNEFAFCSFIKIENPTKSGVLFTIQNDTDFLYIMSFKEQLGVFHQGVTTKYRKKFQHARWFHLCIKMNENKITITQNYVANQPIKTSSFNNVFDDDLKNASTPYGQNVFCIGDIFNKSSFTGEISGLTELNYNATALQFNSDKCLTAITTEQSLFMVNFTTWNLSGQIETKETDSIELCLGSHSILVVKQVGDYKSHKKFCQGLRGRFLMKEEIFAYGSQFPKNSNCFEGTSKKETLLWKKDKMYAEVENSEGDILLKEIEDPPRVNISMNCPYFSFPGWTNGTVSCFKKLECVACLYPNSVDVLMYGDLNIFDRHYNIREEDLSLKSRISNRSSVILDGTSWSLTSSRHDEVWILQNSTLPIGRNMWSSQETEEVKLLTFTTCDEGEFFCSDGECRPLSDRCNGILDCSDRSDEQECQYIEKKEGYRKEKLPSPVHNQTRFLLHYFIEIKGSDEIKVSEGSTRFDVMIFLLWNDPGLVFWHGHNNNIKVNASSIWNPKIGIKDQCKQGMQMDVHPYRSQSIANPHPAILFSTGNQMRTQSPKDPYMGVYVDGAEQLLVHSFNAIVDLSCGFELHDYPFGTQTCSICFHDDNAAIGGFYELVPYAPYHSYRGSKDHLEYRGNEDLGEVRYVSSIQTVFENKIAVEAVLTLAVLYEYHLLNSFVPSTVMFLIAYATLFYPIICYNERVSVSLTALLALVVHFVETNAGELQTPYFKLLDIWFVVLIFMSFIIIVFNGHLHLLKKLEEGNVVVPEGDDYKKKGNIPDLQKMKRANKALIFFVPLLFALFLCWFVMRSIDALD